MLDEEWFRSTSLFHPYYAAVCWRVRLNNVRFVHYTSAEAAASILMNGTLWMRDARIMNDFSEIEYGLERLETARSGPIGDQLNRCLNRVAPGIADAIDQMFKAWSERFTQCTYLVCFSEHDQAEDLLGRLSMWRAYGRRSSVALVMNNAAFLSPAAIGIEAYASPVLYADKDGFDLEFGRLVHGLESRETELAAMDPADLCYRMFRALFFAALCTKHPGFAEEQEWRVTHSAELDPSKHLTKTLRVVGGVPQLVHEIPLKSFHDGFSGSLGSLLDRIIIGPSDDGRVVRDAFVHILEQVGVPDPARRVFVSGIPLRG